MRRLGFVLFYFAAAVAGLASAWWSLKRHDQFGIAVGPWRVSTLVGSNEADMHTRARVAVGALLALQRSETMYYLARTDSTGAPLRSRCAYRITGVPPAAPWWSVTAYADDFFLFPDSERRYSLNGSTARLDAQGRFELVSGPARPEPTAAAAAPAAAVAPAPPWLPTPGDRGLLFTLRVYQPAEALRAAPQALAPPRIEALGPCR
jgi:hypothetical protein